MKIVMVIAFRDFRDLEYFIPKEEIEKTGAKISTVSSQKGLAVGTDGGEVNVDLEIGEVSPENFDAVLFIGGPGMAAQLDNENFQRLARETVTANKALGAICIAPALLAKAGVLEGKKATVWSSPMDKSPVKMLEKGGAVYEDKTVVVDGKIVTANGPGAAKAFAEAVISIINNY